MDTQRHKPFAPLADRVRPNRLEDIVGQRHLLAAGRPLRVLLEAGRIYSLVLWGPSGSGKTTMARVMANCIQAQWIELSAVRSGMKEIRGAVNQALTNQSENRKTIVFVDEAHRFNKAQQDAFLPYIEDATIIFIGATTQNPSFELNGALLSRCRVVVLKPLELVDLLGLIDTGITQLRVSAPSLKVQDGAKKVIAELAQGDARQALNLLEVSVNSLEQSAQWLTEQHVIEAAGNKIQSIDKNGDQFYQLISAFHKSVRGSNPDASLYWMARMMNAGYDPFIIARRLTVIASEDIGNADPRALTVAIDAWEALKRLGQPEGELALAQATTYLASAPKSNASYTAYKRAREDAAHTSSVEVPLHLRNASTQLQAKLGYKQAYHYAHDDPNGYSPGQRYLPDALSDRQYYLPVDRGLESKIRQRLDYLRQLDPQKKPA